MAKTTADFEFIPARAGEWTYVDRKLSNEEAGHACAAVSAGVTVLEVRIDRPDDSMGVCATIPGTDVAGFRRQLFCTLAGPLVVGRVVPWPPDVGDGGDEGVAARLVLLLDIDEGSWYRVVAVVAEFLRLPSTKRAITAVAGALLERGALTGDEVHEIVDGAQISFGSASTPPTTG